ncbi:MAG: ABC-type transport auxiliary lipoprotein family protein [Hyphomicrobiaceae bacterium]
MTAKASSLLVAISAAAGLWLSGCASTGLETTSNMSKTYELGGANAPAGSIVQKASTSARRDLQLVVNEPSASRALDGDRVVVHRESGEISFLAGATWSDRLPVLVQSRLIQALSASEQFRAISNGRDKVNAEISLSASLQAFQVDLTSAGSIARVALQAKLVSERTGEVLASRTLSATRPVAGKSPGDHVAAINQAFAVVSGEVVAWAGDVPIKVRKGPGATRIVVGSVKPKAR